MPISDFIDDDDRAWLDWRWNELAKRVGAERIRSGEVYSSIESFAPANRAISRQAMQTLAEKIAAMLGVIAFPVRVVHGSTESHEDAERFEEAFEAACQEPDAIVIAMEEANLADPQVAAFFMMKQIVTDHLVRMGWLEADAPDAVEAGELAAVQMGAGMILANNVYVDNTVTFGIAEWGRSFMGTALSLEHLAYAVARQAYLRDEAQPAWKRWLKADPKRLVKNYLTAFESSPPPERSHVPTRLLSPTQRMEMLAEQAGALEEGGWDEDELTPPNPMDFDTNEAPVYCKACAYNVAHLPAGDCPECGRPFDPEDLRTVTTTKPMVVSETTHRTIAATKKLILWLAIGFAGLAVAGAAVVFLGNVFGVAPKP